MFIACAVNRWGSKRDDADGGKLWGRPPTWKVRACNLWCPLPGTAHGLLTSVFAVAQERYMDRDTIDMQEVTKSVSALLRPFYAQVPF